MKQLVGAFLFVAVAVALWWLLQYGAPDPFAGYVDPSDSAHPYSDRIRSCHLDGGTWNTYTQTCNK